MTFSEALEHLKEGRKVERYGWNGKDMYLKLMSAFPVNGHLHPGLPDDPIKGVSQGAGGQMLSHIVLCTGPSKSFAPKYSDYVPWVASHTDLLSDDWELLPD